MRKLWTLLMLWLISASPAGWIHLASAAESGGELSATDLLKPDLPVEWQKIAIDELIRARIKRALSQNIPEQYYAVTVSTTLRNVPRAPAKTGDKLGGGSLSGSANEGPAVGKLNIDLSLLLNSQKNGAPEAAEPPPSAIKLISSVDVSVLLDKRVPEERKTVVQDIVQGIIKSVTAAPAQITVNSVSLYTPPEKLAASDADPGAAQKSKVEPAAPPPPEPSWSFQRWIAELKYVLAIILVIGALLFAYLTSVRNQRAIEARRVALLEAKDAREEQAAERQRQSIVVGGGTPGDQEMEKSARKMLEEFEKGIERFRTLLTSSPDRAAQLVRQWLRNPKHGASEALTLLPQAIPMKELTPLFDRLGREERKEWRQYLALPHDATSVRKADGFIASQIVEAFLSPIAKMDEATRRELNELSLGDCIELVRESPSFGAVLASVLPPGQVARIFTVLPPEMSSQITSESLRLGEENLAQAAGQMMKRVLALKAQKKHIRFLDHASELMADIGPERESAIFSALSESGEYRLLEAAARQLFPAELVTRLPQQVLKTCLDAFPLERRAEIIFTQEGSNREQLLRSYGADGSRMRELLDLELERISGDDFRKHRLMRNRNALWKALADQARLQIRRDDSARESADELLGSWLYERSSGAVGAQGEVTRAAA